MEKILSKRHTIEKFNIDYDNPQFVLLGGDITQWSKDNSRPQPTEEELTVWYNSLTTYWSTRDVLLARRLRYPSWDKQMDMMWHDKKEGTTTWEDAIQAVKDANPKGGS